MFHFLGKVGILLNFLIRECLYHVNVEVSVIIFKRDVLRNVTGGLIFCSLQRTG